MKAKKDYVVIIGCGRLGSYLGSRLCKEGHTVAVIDKDENSFERLQDHFHGVKISADVEEIDVLLQANIHKADLVIASTEQDSTNLMIAQIAKRIYGVPRVIARIYDPRKTNLFGDLDIELICPTILAAGQLVHSL